MCVVSWFRDGTKEGCGKRSGGFLYRPRSGRRWGGRDESSSRIDSIKVALMPGYCNCCGKYEPGSDNSVRTFARTEG
jgi:hypothetical protein